MTTYTITGYVGALTVYTPATATTPPVMTEASFTSYARSGAIVFTYDNVANTISWTEGWTYICTGSNSIPDVGLGVWDAGTGGNPLFGLPITSTTVANTTSLSVGPGSFAVPPFLFTPAQQTPMGTQIGTFGQADGVIPAGAAVVAGVPLAVGGSTIVAGQQNVPVALTDGATITLDGSKGTRFSVTLGANRLLKPVNLDPAKTARLYVTQDGTGTRTLTGVLGVLGAGGSTRTIPLTATAAAIDRVDLDFDGTTTWANPIKAFN